MRVRCHGGSVTPANFTVFRRSQNGFRMSTALYFVMIILSVLLIGVILLQGKSNSFGGSLTGGSDSIYRTRRGFDKTVFNTTIVLAIIWAVVAAISSVVQ